MDAAGWLAEAQGKRRSGDEAGALAAYAQAVETAHAVFAPAIEAEAQLGLAELRVARDDPAGARQAFDEAIGRAVEAGARELEAEAWFGLASACFDTGHSKDGHDALLEAMALARELADEQPSDRGRKLRLARAIRLYGEHIGVLGSPSDARQALEVARLMYVDLGEADAARGVEQDIASLDQWAR